MTNVVILAGLLFAEMALSAQSSVAGTNDVLSEVTRSAQEGLRRYLIEVPKREIEDCGLPTGVTPERLSLSRPFQVHSISPDVLSNLTSVTSTEQLFIPTTQYYVPVLVDGIPRSILIVDRVQDQWKAVSFGHALLATA